MDLATAMEFIGDKRNGILITTKGDGRPQSSNIAYALRDGRIVISVTDSRAKTRNVRRSPQVSLHVNAADFWEYVVVEADVELMPVAADPHDATVDALVEYFRALQGEHENWDDYRRAMVDDGRLLLLLTPTHAYGMVR